MRGFIARSAWLAPERYRLDAAAYAAGGLEARDRIHAGPWPSKRLDQVSRPFNEARFARTYVMDPAHGVPYLTASDMRLVDLKGLLYLSLKKTPQMLALILHCSW